MAQITTTNRMAILDLIAQADETTEVAGLSASVTQLQIDVAGLSASVAGLTASAGTSGTSGTSGVNGTSGTSGNTGASGTSGTSGVSGTSGTSGVSGTSGTSVNGLNNFLSLDVASGVATFSASASITSTVTDGTDTSTQILEKDSFGLNITTTTNNSFAQVDILKTQFYTEISDGTGYTNIDMSNSQMGLYVDDGITNSSTQILSPASIQSTVTDGTNTGQFNVEALTSQLSLTDGASQLTQLTLDPLSILIDTTDGSYTSGIEIINEYSRLHSGQGIYFSEFKVNGDATIQTTSTDGTNTSTQNISPTEILSTVTDGTNSNSISSVKDVNIHLVTDGTYTTTITLQSSSLQTTSTDGTNTTTETMEPTYGSLTSTDGTSTAQIVVDNSPNILISSTDGTNTSSENITSIDITTTVTNGIGTTYSENFISGQEQYLSTITDNKISQINLDPAALNTGTIFKSEDLTVGSSAILSLGYDGNSSFDMVDGTGNSSYLTFTPTNILMSSTDGSTFTSTLEIDPLETGNFTNLSTSDGTTVNKLQVSQGDAILSSSIGGTTQSSVITQPASIELTSTDGTNTTTENITPSSYNISTTDGTDTSVIDMNKSLISLLNDNKSTGKTAQITLDPANAASAAGSVILVSDGLGTQSTITFNENGIASETTNGTDTNSILLSHKVFDATWTDGTKSNTIYHEYNPFSELQALDVYVGNGTSLTTAVSLSQDTNSSQIMIEAGDRGYDGTTYSTIFLQESQVLVKKVYNGYEHRLEFYNDGAIDLFMTDGISTSGGLYVEPNMTSVQCGGTAGSTEITLTPDTLKITGIPVIDIGTYSAFNDAAIAYGLTAGHIYTNYDDLQGLLKIVY